MSELESFQVPDGDYYRLLAVQERIMRCEAEVRAATLELEQAKQMYVHVQAELLKRWSEDGKYQLQPFELTEDNREIQRVLTQPSTTAT